MMCVWAAAARAIKPPFSPASPLSLNLVQTKGDERRDKRERETDRVRGRQRDWVFGSLVGISSPTPLESTAAEGLDFPRMKSDM